MCALRCKETEVVRSQSDPWIPGGVISNLGLIGRDLRSVEGRTGEGYFRHRT